MKLSSRPSLRKKESRLPLLLSFFLPFVIAGLSYTILPLIFQDGGLYPFGDKMILAHDGWHQYYPFFQDFQSRLLNGQSLQYTWSVGMGIGYVSLFAYYLASPLNLLVLLMPSAYLTELFAFLTILKISLAGLFFGLFLKLVYRRNDMMIPFFALAYAFCSWTAGYYWNIMWLDAFALLPLLVAATVCLLREGKFRLYIASLALTLWCNYYVAFFCCIFVFLCFVGYCLICWNGFGNFLRRFARIAICTVIGAGLTALLLIPTMKALQTTVSAATREVEPLALNMAKGAYGIIREDQSVWEVLKDETLPGVLSASRQVLSALMTKPETTSMEGLPNVFCGFSTVILAIYFFFSKKIKLREKIFNLCLLLFLMLSFIFRILDYVWHGFHFPNMLPYRFSFLFSFVLVAMAYRAFTLLEDFKKWHLLILIPLAGGLIANIALQETPNTYRLILSGLVLAGVVAALLIYGQKKQRKLLGSALLAAVMVCEMVLCFGMGIAKIGFTTRSTYPKEETAVQALLSYEEENGGDPFYRTEVVNTQTLNDGALNGYNGVSIFTSSANVNFNRFSRSLGLSSWPASNRFSYYEASPFTNTLCGIRYLIDRDGGHLNGEYNSLVATSGGSNLLECRSYIGLGFMTEQELGDFVAADDCNPFLAQEELFLKATGVQEPLFTPLTFTNLTCSPNCSLTNSATLGTNFNYSSESATERSSFSIYYTVEEAGLYCASTRAIGFNEVHVYRNGQLVCSRNVKAQAVFAVGDYVPGDELKFVYFIDQGKKGTISLEAQRFNDEAYRRGLETLSDERWELTEFDGTELRGTIDVARDGLFYTAIPYEPGWTATVDGEAVELGATYDPSQTQVKLTDAVIAFPLTQGTHEICLRYRMPGLVPGLLISLTSLALLAGLAALRRKDFTLLPDVEKAPREPSQPDWQEITMEEWEEELPPDSSENS